MAGVGVRLNRLYSKKSLTADLAGIVYSVVITIAPILLVILSILLMGYLLRLGEAAYLDRELFSCTVLYILIFGLLVVSPFIAVFSKYVQDAIFEEKFQEILPCFYLGAMMEMVLACILGVPFCLWEHFVGGVSVFYVFTGFCGYISLILVFHCMIYLSSFKDYERTSLFFFIGMALAVLLSWILCNWFHWEVTVSMLLSLGVGFLIIAVLEFAAVRSYFPINSNHYKPVLVSMKKWWFLIVMNFFYILGLYVHIFVFWTAEERRIVVDSFVINQPYDMASCLAVFTSLSSTVIFVTHLVMRFRDKYKRYSESVIGGKQLDIETAKQQLFSQLGNELMDLVRIQFTISVVVYLLCIVFAPQFGLAGMVMRIYPSLAVGYFIVYVVYAVVLLLNYFSDAPGMVMTTASFVLVTLIGSIVSKSLPEIWYGMGLVVGAFAGWTVGYMRLRWLEKHMDVHIFCRGTIVERKKSLKPSGLVYQKGDRQQEQEQDQEKVNELT